MILCLFYLNEILKLCLFEWVLGALLGPYFDEMETWNEDLSCCFTLVLEVHKEAKIPNCLSALGTSLPRFGLDRRGD